MKLKVYTLARRENPKSHTREDKMNRKLIIAQSIRRLCGGRVRLQKLNMRRIPFFVTFAAFASLSVVFFQNCTTSSQPPPDPPADYVLKPNFKVFSFDRYVMPYVPAGNPRPMS